MKKIILSFLVGLVVGAAAGILIPRWAEPHLPPALRTQETVTEGTVVAKQHRDNQLLLTVDTPEGAVLATFHQKLDEISQLIDEGDVVGLGLRRYEPFAEDPPIRKVVKSRRVPKVDAEPTEAAPGGPGAEPPPGAVEAGPGRPVEETGEGVDPGGDTAAEDRPAEGGEPGAEASPPEKP